MENLASCVPFSFHSTKQEKDTVQTERMWLHISQVAASNSFIKQQIHLAAQSSNGHAELRVWRSFMWKMYCKYLLISCRQLQTRVCVVALCATSIKQSFQSSDSINYFETPQGQYCKCVLICPEFICLSPSGSSLKTVLYYSTDCNAYIILLRSPGE